MNQQKVKGEFQESFLISNQYDFDNLKHMTQPLTNYQLLNCC